MRFFCQTLFCALVLASGSIAQNGHESDSTVQAESNAAGAGVYSTRGYGDQAA
ncbi:hypothetical protein BDV33DRAFT_201065 [Aspergillus novoparasiticus]|uniref:Uncharacterized protein n=1 Tax=Aspergillus novoparasiticus TaxID=986946 RepID=A0A5N6EZW9_9EURO|nr:hypothetical protein BDV33DRAFT_201065 [Aspergillus novoparasiticus]